MSATLSGIKCVWYCVCCVWWSKFGSNLINIFFYIFRPIFKVTLSFKINVYEKENVYVLKSRPKLPS
jgi:hypothetical protein